MAIRVVQPQSVGTSKSELNFLTVRDYRARIISFSYFYLVTKVLGVEGRHKMYYPITRVLGRCTTMEGGGGGRNCRLRLYILISVYIRVIMRVYYSLIIVYLAYVRVYVLTYA